MKQMLKILLPGNGEWYPKSAETYKFWFLALVILIFSGTIGAILSNQLFLLGIPAIFLFIYLTIVRPKAIYFLLWACIPLSTEVFLPGGFGTDLPTEPLMIGMMGVGFLLVLQSPSIFPYKMLRHPLTLILLLHLGWILLTTLTSGNHMVSVKFFLAKIWYVSAFFILPFIFFKTTQDIKKWIWVVLLPLLATLVYVLSRHAAEGFSFASISFVLAPFYRNHVNYACTLVVSLPFVVYLWKYSKQSPIARNFILFGIALILFATYYSYTRAAYVSIPLMIGFIYVVRFRLTKLAIIAAMIGGGLFLNHMITQNTYIEYAPNFDTTIAHYDFEDLVAATYKMEDISTMERFYRWIAGFYMIRERPITGYGPGNFYNYYKSYTDYNFVTYVSDNPEKSGIHNYYLMTATEQGVPGIVIFLILVSYLLVRGEKIYHELKKGPLRDLVLCCMLSTVSILFILLLNDMIETDKVGAFFFINIALLIAIDIGCLKEKNLPDVT